MSRSKQPVFEKPDEPDFIKRMKGMHQAEVQAAERPMTDAPVTEDELPTIANTVGEHDLNRFRKMQGVQETAKKEAEKELTVEDKLKMKAAPKRDQQARLAGLKTATAKDHKAQERLMNLKASLQKDDDAKSDGQTPRRAVKDTARPRKKMKLALLDDET